MFPPGNTLSATLLVASRSNPLHRRDLEMAPLHRLLPSLGVLMLVLCSLPSSAAMAQPAADIPINHTIIIYLENHTFDNLYGKFPGANGLDRPDAQILQVDKKNMI